MLSTPRPSLPSLLLVATLLLAGCGDPEPIFPSGTGGQATGGTTGTGGVGGTAGTGGTGGTFTSCDACSPDAPICVDEMACADECPDGRDLCHPAGAPAAGACCGGGQQCCEAAVFDYSGGDLCRPDGEACPLGCPGSDAACPLQTYCELDPSSGTFACKDECPGERLCAFNLCCPLGTVCADGGCKLPDLSIDAARMAESAHVEVVDFAPDACEIFEGCVGGPGKRTLLRFDLRTPNTGEGDLFLGDPEGNELFEYSMCHNHYHFTAYADYRLLDGGGNEVAFGHKQAFCLEDISSNADPPAGEPKYTCSFQGIQTGWADVYGGGLPCQWVDITGVPPGDYTLHAAVNFEKLLAESSYDNNTADVTVTVPANSCQNGCVPVDAACCKPGDPCGWAGNGSCDCGDFFGWDGADCGECIPDSEDCLTVSSCPAGCSPDSGPCCADGDPCGLAGNYACDCGGAFAWDDADCGTCDNPNPPCPVNTCPNGCTSAASSPQCCVDGDPCGWDGDGFCDCSGLFDWDAQDCGHCTSASPNCP